VAVIIPVRVASYIYYWVGYPGKLLALVTSASCFVSCPGIRNFTTPSRSALRCPLSYVATSAFEMLEFFVWISSIFT
jgi:hypothetical protein